MANISSPEALGAGLSVKGGSWSVRLNWANPTGVAYDKVLIAWRRTDGVSTPPPGSSEINSNINTFTVDAVPPSAAYVFSVKGGQKTDVFQAGINWDYSDWTDVAVNTPALPVVIPPGGRQIVFYSRSGAAFSAPIVAGGSGGAMVGTTHQIGGWENDWTQVVGIHDQGGNPFLLFYKPNGRAFVAPIVMNTNGPGNGPGSIIGGWEGDWTQVVGFTVRPQPVPALLPAEQAADRLRRADRPRPSGPDQRDARFDRPLGAGLDPDHRIHPFGLAVLSSLPPERWPGLPRPDRRRLARSPYRPDTNAGRLEERAMGPDPRFRLQRFGIPASLPQQRPGFHRPDLVRFERRSDRDAESGGRLGGELGAVRGSVVSLRGPSLRTGQRLGRQTARALPRAEPPPCAATGKIRRFAEPPPSASD